MDKKLWIGTSWKMNKNQSEAIEFANALLASKSPQNIQRFVIPGFTNIRKVKEILKSTDIKIGAQNMHWEENGAWTGEVSPLQLCDCGMDMVELGHSERREFFGETDETVGLKAEAAISNGLIPLICIGETAGDKDSGNASQKLEQQTRAALERIKHSQFDILLAYEPVWAIGDGGTPASAEYANSRQAEIKTIAREIMGREIPCLYGGSVNQQNAKELSTQEHIDGLFIGRSAWNAESYIKIIELCDDIM